MAVYGLAVFTSAFLLFLVQPLLGKYILPWFGGGPAVWTSCLMVYQVLLLAGYAYAHVSTRWLKARAQVVVHLMLLIAAMAVSVAPDISWKPQAVGDPTLRICLLLAACLGLPFIVLSATAPLLQHWCGLTQSRSSPFRLYAVSNAGSQLALWSYPLLFENFLGRGAQVLLWRVGLGIFGITCLKVAERVWKAGAQPESAAKEAPAPAPALPDRILWVVLPACGALLLAAITNKICQDLAPIALLWVLPLSIYLLSFILCFSGSRFYDRRWFGPLLAVSLVILALSLRGGIALSPRGQVAVFLGGFLVCCMVCHGEVYRLRPHPNHLTSFYLLLSVGGVLGGAFVALIAPRVFNDYDELQVGLMLCGGLAALTWPRGAELWPKSWTQRLARVAGTAAAGVLAWLLWHGSAQNEALRVYRARNFYGVLKVFRHSSAEVPGGLVELVHGRVAHGVQFLASAREQTPTLYYTRSSGVGRAFERLSPGARRLGVVGLGAGTLAAYARPGDRITFYEINSEVQHVAESYFNFLKKCEGQVNVVLGDARLSLENQISQQFDLLVLDAFNSDSIPIHLLTREAFELYQRHLKKEGIIAVHISNMSLNLEPLVAAQAGALGDAAEVFDQNISNEALGILPSTWMLLTADPAFASETSRSTSTQPAAHPAPKGRLWTDDFNGCFALLRWGNLAKSGDPAQTGSPVLRDENYDARTLVTIERFRQAVAAAPDSPVALNNLACLLATAADPALRDGPEAVRLAEKACTLTQFQNISTISTLAAAYAEAGRFDEAVAAAERACAMSETQGQAGLLAGNRQMLDYFRQGRPFHQQLAQKDVHSKPN